MNRIFRNFLILSMLVLAFSACRKKAFDEYYGRPATLANPIYQRLGELGNFKSLIHTFAKSSQISGFIFHFYFCWLYEVVLTIKSSDTRSMKQNQGLKESKAAIFIKKCLLSIINILVGYLKKTYIFTTHKITQL